MQAGYWLVAKGLSCVCGDFRFRHSGCIDVGLPDDPRIDVGVQLLQPFRQDLRRVALTCAVRKQHDTVGIAQRLGYLVVKSQVFRRALPTFLLFVAVVKAVQEMMRIVGSDSFATLIRGKTKSIKLRTVMINQHHNIHGFRLGRRT